MAVIETWHNQDLSAPVQVQYIHGNVFSQDNNGNLIGVNVYKDGLPAELSGSVSASVIRADGATVAVAGVLSGNQASVTLPQACYAVPGVLSVVIKLTSGTTVTTLCAVVANVYQSTTDTVVDPGTIIPDIGTLVEEIEAAIASIPADYSTLWETIAPNFSTNKAYKAGEYATYNGALYRFKADHAAGTWDSTEVVTVDIGDELSALNTTMTAVSETAKSKNILNPSGHFDNGYISPTNGAFTASESYVVSDYIPVVGGMYFVASDNTGEYSECRFIAEYDSSKTIIPAPAQTQGEGNGTHYKSGYIQLDSSCAFVRVTIAAGRNKNNTMWEISTISTPSEFEAYFAPQTQIKDTALPADVPIMEWLQVENLLDDTTFSDGYVSATSGTVSANENYTTTDFIHVDGGKILISSSQNEAARWFTVAQYDSNQNVIVGKNERLSQLRLFDGAVYIRVTYQKSEYNTYTNLTLFTSDIEGYITAHYEIKQENLLRVFASINEINEVNMSPLYGKRVAWYGDSIIQNTWWQTISDTYSMTSTNCGVGGTKISGTAAASMCQVTRINGQYEDVEDPNTGEITAGGVAIPLDAEIIIIGAGTNDWAQNVPLGEKNLQYDANWNIVESVTTFYQACHVMFRRLCELRPDAKIIVLGTPFGRMANRTVFDNKYGILNNQGLSTLDYGNALCEIAEMWGFYAFRYGEKMGINDNNIAGLLDPGGDGHLHPTTPTAKEMFRKATLNCFATIKYIP